MRTAAPFSPASPFTVRLASAVVAPTVFAKVILPLEVSASACAPSTHPRLSAPAPVSIASAPFKVVAARIATARPAVAVVTTAPPGLPMTSASADVSPKVTAPPLRNCAPLKVTLPLNRLSSPPLPIVTSSANVTALLEVCTMPVAVPTAPVKVVAPAESIVIAAPLPLPSPVTGPIDAAPVTSSVRLCAPCTAAIARLPAARVTSPPIVTVPA